MAWLALALARAGAAQRTVAEAYVPGEEARWVFEQGDLPIGSCAARYDGEVDLGGLRVSFFQAWVVLTLATPEGPLEQRSTVDLWTDSTGHPLRFHFQVAMADTYVGVEATLAGGKADVTIRQGPSVSSLSIDVPPGAYLLTNNFVSQLELVLALGARPGEPATFPMFSANALRGFELALEPEPAEAAAPGTAVFRDSLGEVLRLSPDGRLQEVLLPAQGIVLKRRAGPVERFRLSPPASAAPAPDLEREDVTIEYGDVAIAGTITRPRGASGRLPAAFFVSGSGSQDREGLGAGLDVGTHEILDRLTLEGLLVLRVDDRGAGETRGPVDDVDYDALVEDAHRAVRFLRERSDVDPARIVLLGQSEGGVTAPILAAEEPAPAAVVLLAAPGRGVGDLLEEQLLRLKRSAGSTPEELAAFGLELRSFLAQVGSEAAIDAEALAPELRAFLPARAWLADHVRLDPLAAVRRVRCPVLILQGASDIQVSAERDAPRLVAALDEAGHADHELVVFPGLDHLFKRTVGAESSGLDYLKARPVDPAFLDTLVAWLRPRLGLPAK